MTPKDELYQIAMDLERFSEEVLREEPVKKLQAFVDRMMDVARRLDWHPTESDMRPLSTTGHGSDDKAVWCPEGQQITPGGEMG